MEQWLNTGLRHPCGTRYLPKCSTWNNGVLKCPRSSGSATSALRNVPRGTMAPERPRALIVPRGTMGPWAGGQTLFCRNSDPDLGLHPSAKNVPRGTMGSEARVGVAPDDCSTWNNGHLSAAPMVPRGTMSSPRLHHRPGGHAPFENVRRGTMAPTPWMTPAFRNVPRGTRASWELSKSPLTIVPRGTMGPKGRTRAELFWSQL